MHPKKHLFPPFSFPCGSRLKKRQNPVYSLQTMKNSLLNIIKKITQKYGEAVLNKPGSISAFLEKQVHDVPRPQKNAFIKSLEYGFVKILKNTAESERAGLKQHLAQKLHDEEGFDIGLCRETIKLLAAVLFNEEQKQEDRESFCKTCGNGMQEEWKGCPWCLTPPESQNNSPVNSSPFAESCPRNMVKIQGGTFLMGSPADEPGRNKDECLQNEVTIRSFYMGAHLVSQEDYMEIKANPSYFKGPALPVEQVSWYDVIEYCNKLSQQERLTPVYAINGQKVSWDISANGYRLPTEAEWEYACRAGTTAPFNTGNNITTGQANFNGNYPYNGNDKGNYRQRTSPLGSFEPNAWGLYDMHGNVWEWCWDSYQEHPGAVQADPANAPQRPKRVIRGGSWGSDAHSLRSAAKIGSNPSYQFSVIGFRLVRSAAL